MKKLVQMSAMAALVTFAACKKKEEEKPTPKPGTQIVELTGDLSTQTLRANTKYLLKNQVFVRDGQTLTIEPGTVILGDKRTRGVLVIDKGGKLEAVGTVDKPIVFTSNQPEGIRDKGDWGGIVILGRANVNQNSPAIEGITPEVVFGTTNSTANDNESSGTLRYVRIEFGGIELTQNNETNSLTMGGVGRGTEMEYIQLSFGGDDGFEWFGGCNNGKYLISTQMWDDDFDVDFGYSGNVQFGLAVRYPGYADQSQSNGFECDNGPNDNDVQPYTTGTFSNITVIGPIKEGRSVSNGNFAHAIDLRRRTAVSIVNSVFAGFPRGIRMNQASVYDNYTNNVGVLTNNVLLAGDTNNFHLAGSGVTASNVRDYWNANNSTIAGPMSSDKITALGLKTEIFYDRGVLANDYPTNPDFTVTSGTLTTGASFSNAKFSEANRAGFFDTSVQFIGAFGSNNWAAGWTEFDPVDKVY